MDHVIEKISQIEHAADRILNGAANRKKILDKQQEARIAAFDKELEDSTTQEVQKLQDKLSGQIEQELSQLRKRSEKALHDLEHYYEENHDVLSTEIYNKIIRK